MSTLIKNNQISENNWALADEVGDKKIVTALFWKENAETLQDKISSGEVALWLKADESIADLPDDFEKAAFVAVEFPKFVDGRGYTIGRELRQVLNYKGEVRAIGDVLHDQINAMARCGFDAFELSDEHNAEKALSAFSDFTMNYQADVKEVRPVYSR